MRSILRHQAIRFVLVGVLNTLFGYALFCLFIYLGLHYAAASLFAISVGIIFNFRTTGLLVFKNADKKLFLKFLSVYGIIYLLKILLIWLAKALAIPNIYLIGMGTYLFLAPLTFLMHKYFVFKESSLP